MINGLSPANLVARSAAIMGALAAYIIPPNFALPKRWNGMMSEATEAARRPSWPPKQVFARGLTISVVAIALLALAAMPPSSASAATNLFASNIGRPTTDIDNTRQQVYSSTSAAQRFTTGSLPEAAEAFALKSVEMDLDSMNAAQFRPGQYTASIRSVGSDDNPGNMLYELEDPGAGSLPDDLDAPAGATLEARTSYFLMVEYSRDTDNHRVNITTTSSNSEDSANTEGWSIHNHRHILDVDNDTWETHTNAMRIQVKAGVIMETPANLTAEVLAPQQVRLTWDQVFKLTKDDYDPEEFPGYDIRWSADGESSWRRLVYWNAYYGRRFYDSTIPPGTTRYYRIRAVSKNGDESAYSNVVSATTPGLVDSGNEQIRPGVWASELDALNDQKVFLANLDAGEKYWFTAWARHAHKHRVIVTDEDDREVENFVRESNQTLEQSITAQRSGEHKIKISHAGSLGHFGGLSAGPFHLALLPVHDPGPDRLSLGAGELLNDDEAVVLNTYGDTDRIRVFVQPGKAYSVRVLGREDGLDPPLTAATPRIARARPPSWQYTDYHMGKPWVEGVTTTAASTLCPKLAEPEKCEFQAFVIDLRGISGAQQTWQIEVAPTQRPGTRPYRIGGYAVEVLELSSSQLQGVRMPLRAWFASQPVQHDGTKRIKVQVAFSEAPENVGADGVQVEGGTVTSVSPVDSNAPGGAGTRSQDGQDEGPEDQEVVWEFEIEPDSDEDVTVSLAAWSPCGEPGAICTADGRTLSTATSTTVRGPDEVAAPEPPDQPRSLEATATPDRVVLTWDDPQDDSIAGYVVLRRIPGVDPEGQFDELVANTGTAATTYTDNSVAAETRYTYRIKAINEHGTSERSRWVHIDTPAAPEPETPPEPDNNPATGAPIISGTAQVGETLTADRSEIADEDGTENATFSYQWLADDADILGATASTYTLADAQEDKAIKVEVTFTDDAGNDESLTSAATDGVLAAAEPSEPPDQPTGLEATATHDRVVLTWDDPGDDSITGYVILRRVRVNDQGGDFSVLVANTETAATTYTDDTVAASTTYTYRIKAINEHGASERSRWVHVDTPAAP